MDVMHVFYEHIFAVVTDDPRELSLFAYVFTVSGQITK